MRAVAAAVETVLELEEPQRDQWREWGLAKGCLSLQPCASMAGTSRDPSRLA